MEKQKNNIFRDDEHKQIIQTLMKNKKRPSYIPEYIQTEIKDKYLIMDYGKQTAQMSKSIKIFMPEIYKKSQNYKKWIEENEYLKTKHYIIWNDLHDLSLCIINNRLR